MSIETEPTGRPALRPRPLRVTLIGFGAIGAAVFDALSSAADIVVDQIIVSPRSVAGVRRKTGLAVAVVSDVNELPARPAFVLECAGHAAIGQHVIPLIRRGIECAIVSVGALADDTLRAALEGAAAVSGVRPTLLSGAVGGLDALAAAAAGGLDEVRYTGRKPLEGWRGTPADATGTLDGLRDAVTIFEGSAGEAATRYPKNANVAASIALAGVGFEQTRVRLIADPAVSRNTHSLYARGRFGELQVEIAANPLEQNPKTSALTAFCAVGFLRGRAARR